MCLAVPLKIVKVSDDLTTCLAAVGGSTIEVGISLVPEVRPGDYILVHAGMAIEKIDEREARETLELYREYAELPDLIEPEPGNGHG